MTSRAGPRPCQAALTLTNTRSASVCVTLLLSITPHSLHILMNAKLSIWAARPELDTPPAMAGRQSGPPPRAQRCTAWIRTLGPVSPLPKAQNFWKTARRSSAVCAPSMLSTGCLPSNELVVTGLNLVQNVSCAAQRR